jgi:hypothetical protein
MRLCASSTTSAGFREPTSGSPLGRMWRLRYHHVPCRGGGRAATGVRLSRWHDRTCSSKVLGCKRDQIGQMSPRFNCNVATRAETLGRSRGGLGTKIIGVCGAAERLVDFLLVPGQA